MKLKDHLTLSNQKGAGIAMVLVISSIVSVVGVGVMNMSGLLFKTKKQLAVTSEADNLAYHIVKNFVDRRACSNTFKTYDPTKNSIIDGPEVTKIVDGSFPTPNTLYTSGETLGLGTQGRITLSKITVINYPITLPAVTGPPSMPASENNAHVFLQFEKKSMGKTVSFNRRFLIKVEVDGSNQIVNCFYEKDAEDSILPKKVYTNPKMGFSQPNSSCNALGGKIDSTDGLCKNITLKNNPSLNQSPFAPGPHFPTYFGQNDSHNYALKAVGRMRVTNSLYLNKDPVAKAPLTGLSTSKGDIIGSGNITINLLATISNSLGVGISAPGTAGKAHFNLSAAIGGGDAPPKGLFIGHSLGVNATPPENPGWMRVNDKLSIETSTLPRSSDSLRTKEGIQITTDLSNATLDDDDAVTRGFFSTHISKALGINTSEQNAIKGFLVSTQVGNTYTTIRNAVCAAIEIDGNLDSPLCNWNTSYSISKVGNHTVKLDIGSKTMQKETHHCGKKENCSKICVNGSCFTAFSSQQCPFQKVMVGIRSNGGIICEMDQAGWGGW